MQAVQQLIRDIKNSGFHGTYLLYYEKKGEWHNTYALFDLEFEDNNTELSLALCELIEYNAEAEVICRGSEFEVIGYIDQDEYWAFPLIDCI